MIYCHSLLTRFHSKAQVNVKLRKLALNKIVRIPTATSVENFAVDAVDDAVEMIGDAATIVFIDFFNQFIAMRARVVNCRLPYCIISN